MGQVKDQEDKFRDLLGRNMVLEKKLAELDGLGQAMTQTLIPLLGDEFGPANLVRATSLKLAMATGRIAPTVNPGPAPLVPIEGLEDMRVELEDTYLKLEKLKVEANSRSHALWDAAWALCETGPEDPQSLWDPVYSAAAECILEAENLSSRSLHKLTENWPADVKVSGLGEIFNRGPARVEMDHMI